MATENYSSESCNELLDRAQRTVRRVVDYHRHNRGQKTLFAFADAAVDLDATPARTKALYYLDKVWRITRDEVEALEMQLLAHLDREDEAARKKDQERSELRRQLTLGDIECGRSSGSGDSGCGGGSANGWAARADEVERKFRELRAEVEMDRVRRRLR